MNSALKPISRRLARASWIVRQCLPARTARCRGRWARRVVATVLAWSCCWLAAHASARQPEPSGLSGEYAVKAAFLYSFGRYIEWPEDTFRNASEPFVIGIVGKDSFDAALNEIAAKKTIQERQIVVRRFATPDQYQQPCHILFVSRSLPKDQQTALIRKTRKTAMFVVGETPGFAENGGGANFYLDGDQVRFEINVATARQSQLRMDAKLLNLGKPVGSQRTAAAH